MAETQTSLRVLRREDAPRLAALRHESADRLRPWEPTRPAGFATAEGQLTYIEQCLASFEREESMPFAITSQDRVIGQLTLSGITRGALQSCALGYWVAASDARRGHATRGVAMALLVAFTRLGLHRVQAETLPENAASRAVLERNDFVQYGRAPQYLQIAGRWRDHLMFQCLAPEAA